jgi:methyltransferase (TIGR00027 family)
MLEAKPSRTAMRVAMHRAAHQLFDSAPRVLDDPVAVPIIGAGALSRLQSDADQRDGFVPRALRAFMVARSRFAEDELLRAVARGTAQYVVLGAGLDTFAYRRPATAAHVRVFEVDHPSTQAWKRSQLAAASIPIPAGVTFAPVDFERETLGDGLAQAGFDRTAPAFFSWLGVTIYLTEDAIASTLKVIASTARGGGLAFDYVVPRSSVGFTSRLAFDALAGRVAAAGEPFQTFFESGVLHERLISLGFRSITDLGSDEMNARYFADRTDGLRLIGFLGRVVSAEL